MKLIGLLLNLAVITALASASHHHEALTLRPADHTLVRYIHESLVVQCHSSKPELKLHWKSPKGEIIKEHKGRVHVEQSGTEQLTLMITHISLADKGNWACEDTAGGNTNKSFNLIVYQKITFTENTTIFRVKEGTNATIRCEVKGEPQPNITWNYMGQPIEVETECRGEKFCSLGDGLFINNVTQNDTGEYTCRAYQVNPMASDMQERTVLMKIEHKPMWEHEKYEDTKYAYINGTATIKCEANAEPPANFTWHHNKVRLHNDKNYNIINTDKNSTLKIYAHDGTTVFGIYKCRARNDLGAIERATVLKLGVKPPPPKIFELRGLDSNKFDVNLGTTQAKPTKDIMDVDGYHFEYITEQEFKLDGGMWTNAKYYDCAFDAGATYLITELEPNTTYLMRVASKNRAGRSDFTKVMKFATLSNEPPSASTRLQYMTMANLLYISIISITLTNYMSNLTKLYQIASMHL